MKIFATSDIHNNLEVVEKLKQIEADLIVICGDIHSPETLEKIRIILADKDWFYIRGNMDDLDVSHDSNYLGEQKDNLVPFEWVLTTPFGTYREKNEEELKEELDKLSVNNNSIIVAHNPPFGAGDKIPAGVNVGSHSILEFIKEKQPKIYLCGHIHEDFGDYKIGETLVFNCACLGDGVLRGWYIDTKSLEYEKVEM